MLEHGGKLRQAAEQYGVALNDWLDLSTGINPCGWPVPTIPEAVWRRLPEDNDGLEDAAHAYYQTDILLAVSGSQAAIQALPLLRPRGRVHVLTPTYAEHAYAWQQCGHPVTLIATEEIDNSANTSDVLVLVNPNNPTGHRWSKRQLLDWHAKLQARDGWLIVDEAFMDATPADSLAPHCPLPGLIVLRSLGKFFGLAGARVGFVLAAANVLSDLQNKLGPWTVTGPSRWLATQALADYAWQQHARNNLAYAQQQLEGLLKDAGLTPTGGTALYQWVITHNARQYHHALAQQGILTRLFEHPPSLRFGLPGTPQQWERLRSALRDIPVGYSELKTY